MNVWERAGYLLVKYAMGPEFGCIMAQEFSAVLRNDAFIGDIRHAVRVPRAHSDNVQIMARVVNKFHALSAVVRVSPFDQAHSWMLVTLALRSSSTRKTNWRRLRDQITMDGGREADRSLGYGHVSESTPVEKTRRKAPAS